MKNFTIIDTINLIITLTVIAVISIITIRVLKPSSYSMNVKVISIENNLVTVVDEEGEMWDFFVDENSTLCVDDSIRVSFLNNGTENRTDDKIERLSIILK